ncbi:MAG: site-specific DNA-methyltransferase [Cyanobacteria bacterium P01_C01_bin.73]
MRRSFIKRRAPRNRTLTLSDGETADYRERLLHLSAPTAWEALRDRVICQPMEAAIAHLPNAFVDLLFLDPPYNLTKTFNQRQFTRKSLDEYEQWFEGWLSQLLRLLKPTASVYICGDWQSSAAIYRVASQYFKVRTRITWEREKGRGAKTNWKNCAEDIWFCTCSNQYTFNVEAVKLKRRVIAPYRTANGVPKDWQKSDRGNFRITHPSNLWTDISVPFWSMPENTDHPTQKPEKLLAKLLLASSDRHSVVFDPFLGSGTTAVVAKKLGRPFLGIEVDQHYACLAVKRLDLAAQNGAIQGYSGGYFWERNTLAQQQCKAFQNSN